MKLHSQLHYAVIRDSFRKFGSHKGGIEYIKYNLVTDNPNNNNYNKIKKKGLKSQQQLLTLFTCFLASSLKISTRSRARKVPSEVISSTFKTGIDETMKRSKSPMLMKISFTKYEDGFHLSQLKIYLNSPQSNRRNLFKKERSKF